MEFNSAFRGLKINTLRPYSSFLNLKHDKFPIKIAFVLKIIEAQRQTFQLVGIYPPSPVFFPHSLPYAAVFHRLQLTISLLAIIEEYR
jgi:hypothetical protein